MTFAEIENLSFAELKEQKAGILKSLGESDKAELAARYVQARTDAKLRDDKLGEQGRTLTALEAGVNSLTEQKVSLEQQLAASQQRENEAKALNGRISEASAQDNAKLTAQLQECAKQLQAETARAERLKAEALRHHGALSQSAQIITGALAAQHIENVSQG
jgi:hypothetical protein